MENFTIHIFGYGETQINSKDLSVKALTDSLTKAQPLIDKVYSLKPSDSPLTEKKYHVIHLFSQKDVRWLCKDGFDVKDQEVVLKPFIDALIAELQTVKDSQPTPTGNTPQ